MRDRIYIAGFLIAAGLLLYFGRNLIGRSALVAWSLAFAGTTAVAVLGMALYRVQHELRASRHELARKEAELNFALEVQRALFPRKFPADGGLEFSGVCVPASGISGDYFDVIQVSGRRIAFVLADISGKGISAAILMSNSHAVLRMLAHAGHPPREVCGQLNHHLYAITEASRFATMFYAEWSADECRLRFVNAGHNPPLLVKAQGTERLEAGGPPLGVLRDFEFPEGAATLEAGDLLVLYSDGITEAGAAKGNDFGEARLSSVVMAHRNKTLGEIQEQVLHAVRKHSGEEQEDDRTLLLVRATRSVAEAK
jgi:sigma-B regulation protein RsbU (phosphoserine phosphatase)